jgi:dolichyl-phosphate-mannose--protein O-mannosyl transferase
MNNMRFDRKSNPGQGYEDVRRWDATANITVPVVWAHVSNEAGLSTLYCTVMAVLVRITD